MVLFEKLGKRTGKKKILQLWGDKGFCPLYFLPPAVRILGTLQSPTLKSNLQSVQLGDPEPCSFQTSNPIKTREPKRAYAINLTSSGESHGRPDKLSPKVTTKMV